MTQSKGYTQAFLSNIGLLLALNLMVKPIYIFAIERGFSNAAGSQYGLYFEIFNFCFLLQIVSDWGIQNYNNVFLSRQPLTFSKYFPKILSIKLLLSLSYLILALTLGYSLGYLQKDPLLFILIAGLVLMNTFLTFARSNLSGMGYYRNDSLISLLDKSILIVFGGIVLFLLPLQRPLDIKWLALGQLIAYTTATLYVFYLLFTKIQYHYKWTQFKKVYWFYFLKKMMPFSLILVLSALYIRIDSIMLGQLLEDTTALQQLTIYGNSYRQLDALNMVGFLFSGLLLPMFSRMISNKQSIEGLAQTALGLLLAITISTAIPLSFYGTEVMNVLYLESDSSWGAVFSPLVLAFIPMSSNYIFGNILIAAGKLKQMNILYLVGVIMNIGLNYFAILAYQAQGAAFTTLFTQIFVVLGLVFYCWKLNLLTRILLLGIKILGLLIIAVGICWYFYSPSLLNMFWTVFFIFLSSVLIKVVEPKKLIQLLNK
jgi:O-antigen/teichoic acid export membrane protein